MVRQRMRCDAPSFSPADYHHIMQYAEKKPRAKVLKDLTAKYHTSQKRIYQIWRGEEKNRVTWNQPIHMLLSTDQRNTDQGDQREKEYYRKERESTEGIKEEVEQGTAILKSQISNQELNALYEKEGKRSDMNIRKARQKLGI